MLEQLGDRRRETDQEKADESNYMSFNNIPLRKFAAIETLIVKIPTAKCEAAHRSLKVFSPYLQRNWV